MGGQGLTGRTANLGRWAEETKKIAQGSADVEASVAIQQSVKHGSQGEFQRAPPAAAVEEC